MRHEQVEAGGGCTEVDIAAVWPTTAALAPVPLNEVEMAAQDALTFSEPAAPDVPVAVGRMIVIAYGALIAAFMLSMTGSGESTFVILISALFVTIFFTVPRLFFGIEPRIGRRPALARFMSEGIDTLTGHTGSGAALTQILIVPCLLTLAILTMGVVAAVVL